MLTPAWTLDWAWSLPLIALTLAIHVTAIIGLSVLLLHVRARFERRERRLRSSALLSIAMIGAAGWALALLHGFEAALWAGAYLHVGAIDTPADAMFYSVDAMTTRGASGLKLEKQWEMMGALEAANGVLLFGVSTAFLAGVLTEAWAAFREQARHSVRT
ncbi:hypothetical protein [Methylocella silvestris]|uniref:Uncharacterized protein n=1 Tax=Methylocella silvestris TaxID=199596 RepID=A0A2J7TD90_METSI|nr:hypothetical protein [Methylocella silvestris]PNG24731.1 hypothetical protein CR492_17170 [Methylocella silvestris]